MKIKTDFVTNSSSSCFVLAIKETTIEPITNYLEKLSRHPDAQNEGVSLQCIIKTQQELLDYTNGRPYDWTSKPGGLNFYNMDEQTFKECEKILKNNLIVALAIIDHNVGDMFSDSKYYKNVVTAAW